jgi:predicted RNase H-like nuclease (RuvC/YqgF family)
MFVKLFYNHIRPFCLFVIQGEMEKTIRKYRLEVREKDAEVVKLKESKDQYLSTIDELQDKIRQHETNANNLQKQITGWSHLGGRGGGGHISYFNLSNIS